MKKPGRHTIGVTIKDEGGSKTSAASKIVVGSDHERLVEKVFDDLLDRDADDAAIAFFAGLLDGGTSASTIVAQIEQSTEFLANEIQTFFQQLLHRHAEDAAVAFFSNQFVGGATPEHVKDIILGSPEYLQLHGGNAQGFLNALFQDEFNRGIDPGALTFFSKLALNDSMARGQVAAAVFGSGEFLTDLVEIDFQTFLGRPADPAAVSTFVKALASGMNDEQLVALILGSQEFAANV
jgi:hypothetical protein